MSRRKPPVQPRRSAAEIAAAARRKLALGGLRVRDRLRPTWAPAGPSGAPRRLFPEFPPFPPDPGAGPACAKALEHRFDLLGTGWVHAGRGGESPGIEGVRFPPRAAPGADPGGRWLGTRLNRANVPEARRIWSLVREGPWPLPAYEPIDWQRDLRSGFVWDERTWFRDVRIGSPRGADVKLPWELARMQHLPLLALEFGRGGGTAGRSRLGAEFRAQVLDFVASNPPRFGVNWACPMDVAIRAANWVAARDLFLAAGGSFDAAFEQVLARSVLEHGRHVAANLENPPSRRTNHYLADLAGLLFVASWLPATPETEGWLGWVRSEWPKEILGQFHEEGTNFEASTAYHGLSLEMAVWASALLLRPPAGIGPVVPGPGLPEVYWTRLERAGEFILHLAGEGGRVPSVGDSDDGRFFRFVTTPPEGDPEATADPLDMRRLLAALNGLFGREDFAEFSRGFEAETALVRALAGGRSPASRLERKARHRAARTRFHAGATVEETARTAAEGAPSPVLFAYPAFGLYACRSGDTRLLVRCGSYGQGGWGGHAHNDQLSFVWSVDGEEILVDPGTYVYTPLPDWRDRFRATSAHNTVSVAGEEQAPIEPGQLFELIEDARAVCLEWGAASGTCRFAGEHRGFERLDPPTVHRREIALDPAGALIVADRFLAPSGRERELRAAEWRFQFAPGTLLARGPDGVLASKGKVRILVRAEPASVAARLEEGWISRSYGRREASPALVFESPPGVPAAEFRFSRA